MFNHKLKALLGLCFVVSFIPYSIAIAQTESKPANTYQQLNQSTKLWNLRNADIQNVIEEVSRETGKNFLIDPRVSGKVTIISSQPMPPDELYQVFLSMLQVLGYTAVDGGDVTKIVPLNNANQINKAVDPYKRVAGDEIVVQVIPVRNISATKLVPILRPLIPETSNLSAYEGANTLIVSSTASSIKKIIKIIHDVDKSSSTGIEIIPLYQATASKIVTVLTNLYANVTDPAARVAFAADEHTNSVLLNGDLHSRLRIRALISKLDSPSPAGSTGNTQVLFLHYLKAKDLAPILMKMIEGGGSTEGEEAKPKSPLGSVSIQAEPSTNTIVITAPPATMSTIKHVVQTLDSRPSQVLVEAAIVEVNDKILEQLGVIWGQLVNEDRNSLANAARITTGLPIGFTPGVGVIKAGNLRAIITLIAHDDGSDVLSTPSIMVLDNQQAKIEVGQTLSIETGSYASTNSEQPSANPFTTFSRDNIGLHLYVTPQINRGQAVQLEIDQGNETLQNPNNPTTTPITNNTSLKTTVIVNDKDVLVLGGLLTNSLSKNITKIPYLGDIPIIGNAFSFKSKTMEKRNLMIFIKPTIIHHRKNNLDLTDIDYNVIRNQQIEWEERAGEAFAFPVLDEFTPDKVAYYQEQTKERLLPPYPEQPRLPTPFRGMLPPPKEIILVPAPRQDSASPPPPSEIVLSPRSE